MKATGDVFALGKGKGLQAQIGDYNIYYSSAWTSLTTTQATMSTCTVTIAPTITETVVIWYSCRL